MKIDNMSYSLFPRLFLVPLLATTFTLVGSSAVVLAQEVEEETDPAEITNGERLFLETRFAQLFKVYLDNGGDLNTPLPDGQGDPALDIVVNSQVPSVEHPFKGLSMNCRSCHFVDEVGVEGGLVVGYGMRTYSDFARRSPLPAREDGKTVTIRNSPPLVHASLPRKNFLQHFDGEFKTLQDLVKSTLSGRNYGWIPGERAEAIHHIAKIVREDSGEGDLASEFEAVSYSRLLTGNDPNLPEGFKLPAEFRVDVVNATDNEIFKAVARLIAAYTEDLAFSKDDDGNFNLSPYDVFLEKNGLPRQPQKGESDIKYSQRLLRKITKLERRGQLQFVSKNPNTDNGAYEFHYMPFVFEQGQLEGLKIFFTQKKRALKPHDLAQGKIGNCIACHAAPNFTDFKFHNNGVAQEEYDHIHGPGSFAQLEIPGWLKRYRHINEYLPATEEHPDAKEPFRDIPTAEKRGRTDLGLWNIFQNPDFPKPQRRIWRLLCKDALNGKKGFFNIIQRCHPNKLLRQAIARFKTPSLRDLGHSAPYNHTGQADTLVDVIRLDMKSSNLARNGELRNADRELKKIGLTEQDIAPLVLFVRSLNEDYN